MNFRLVSLRHHGFLAAEGGAVGVVNIDVPDSQDGTVEKALDAIRAIPAVRSACLVKF